MVLFTSIVIQTFPQTPAGDSSNRTEKKRPIVAGMETLLTNVFFIGLDGPILGYHWARPTAATIRKNFSQLPIWDDTDGFKVNQVGHPYQGALYFNSGRANGFNFYESMAFSALGSFTWETIFESQAPSVNDLITTTFASAPPLGEMLHRLYLEADAAGAPVLLSALISPMDGVNRLVAGRPEKAGGNIQELSVSLGANYTWTESVEKSNSQNLFSFHGPTGAVGIKTVYGNPFDQQSVIPYEHFEFEAQLGVDMGNCMDFRIISDGYLFSFSPINTENDTLSSGLSLHFDVVSTGKFDIDDSTIDYAGNALCWTVKHRHLFHNGFVLQSKLHGGVTLLGVSDYFSPDTPDRDLKNYGAGTSVKLFFDIERQNLGKLSLGVAQCMLWTYPGTSAVSAGNVFWLFIDVTYAYRILKHLSIGTGGSFVMENGRFTGFPDTQKQSNTAKVFIQWDL
jgi:hypothetical protein